MAEVNGRAWSLRPFNSHSVCHLALHSSACLFDFDPYHDRNLETAMDMLVGLRSTRVD